MARKFASVKEYAIHLMVTVADTDEDGRFVGLTYKEILKRIRRRFPTITYSGPHKGKPIRMTVKQLREIAYALQSTKRNLRLPVRPRSDRKRMKRSAATPSRKKAAPLSVVTIKASKGGRIIVDTAYHRNISK